MVAPAFFLVSILATSAFAVPIASTDATTNATLPDGATLSVANATTVPNDLDWTGLEEAYTTLLNHLKEVMPFVPLEPGPVIFDASNNSTEAQKREVGFVHTGVSLEDIGLKRGISGSALLKAAGIASTIVPIALKLIPASVKTDVENDVKKLANKLKSFFRRDLEKRQAALVGELAVDAVEDAPAIVEGAESLLSGANILKGVSIASTLGSIAKEIIPESVKTTVEDDAKSAWARIKSWFRREELSGTESDRKLD